MSRRSSFIAITAALLVTSAAFAQPAQLIPNDVKYKDSSVPNGKGQTGGFTLESRTLLNRDGSADVELSANATITKVQVKAGNETDNFNALDNDGNVSFVSHGLIRGQSVQIHANVKGASATDVVQTTEVVKLRPDLSIAEIVAPSQTRPNMPLPLRATIRELNGDVGARANCRLVVDGTEIDRAENIWVDAGGVVDCAFMHTFTSYGLANVAVFVDTTDPTDWDNANNSATKSIDVAERLDGWMAEARQTDYSSQGYSKSPLWETFSTSEDRFQQTYLLAWVNNPVDLSSVRLAVSAKSDGQTIYDAPDVNVGNLTVSEWQSQRCVTLPGLPTIIACGIKETNPYFADPYLFLHISSTASDTVYHGWGYNWWVNPNNPWGKPQGVYDYYYIRQETKASFGTTVQWDLRIVDGVNAVWRDQPFVPLAQQTYSSVSPYRCSYARRYGFEVCGSSTSTMTNRTGSAANVPW